MKNPPEGEARVCVCAQQIAQLNIYCLHNPNINHISLASLQQPPVTSSTKDRSILMRSGVGDEI